MARIAPKDFPGTDREWAIAAANEYGHVSDEMRKAAPGLHFCPDWDDLAIADGDPEMDGCTCPSRQYH